MNKDDAREAIKVMQAYADGEDIQFKTCVETIWESYTTALSFDFSRYDYRIKPKPREFYYLSWRSSTGVVLDTHYRDAVSFLSNKGRMLKDGLEILEEFHAVEIIE